jgi:hypothetical protein
MENNICIYCMFLEKLFPSINIYQLWTFSEGQIYRYYMTTANPRIPLDKTALCGPY